MNKATHFDIGSRLLDTMADLAPLTCFFIAICHEQLPVLGDGDPTPLPPTPPPPPPPRICP